VERLADTSVTPASRLVCSGLAAAAVMRAVRIPPCVSQRASAGA